MNDEQVINQLKKLNSVLSPSEQWLATEKARLVGVWTTTPQLTGWKLWWKVAVVSQPWWYWLVGAGLVAAAAGTIGYQLMVESPGSGEPPNFSSTIIDVQPPSPSPGDVKGAMLDVSLDGIVEETELVVDPEPGASENPNTEPSSPPVENGKKSDQGLHLGTEVEDPSQAKPQELRGKNKK